jgi:hypothetical protein
MPRLRAVRTKEEAAKVPEDQSIAIEIVDEAPPTLEADTKKDELKEPDKKVEAKKEPEPRKEPEADDESDALKKRIEELTKAEKLAKDAVAEAQRRADEATRQHRESQTEVSRYREEVGQAQYDTILNALAAAQSDSEVAKRDLRTAGEIQDWDKLADAQDRLARAASRIERLEEGKIALEGQREQAKREPPKKDTVTDPVEGAIANLPDAAKNWLRSHREYITDSRKNAKIQALHWDVIDEGHQSFSEGYFESLETHLGMREKPKKKDEEDQEERPIVSAPVSRETPSMSTGKPTSTRVTLTPAQRAAARDAGISEIEYAKGVIELENRKKSGYYTN